MMVKRKGKLVFWGLCPVAGPDFGVVYGVCNS